MNGVDIGAYEFGDCQAPSERFRRGDVDASGDLNLTDAIYSLSFQFLGGPAPKTPFPECGVEEWIDVLDCQRYPRCQ